MQDEAKQLAQYSLTNFEDCPVIEQRDYTTVRALADHATELNYKKVQVKVAAYEVKKGSWWSSDFSVFAVECELSDRKEKLRVQRKDADFYALRKLLRAEYPYVLVPPLPDTQKKHLKLIDKQLTKRQRFFQRFLQAVLRSEILRSSKVLWQFLTVADAKLWDSAVKLQEKAKPVKGGFGGVISEEGKVNTQIL